MSTQLQVQSLLPALGAVLATAVVDVSRHPSLGGSASWVQLLSGGALGASVGVLAAPWAVRRLAGTA